MEMALRTSNLVLPEGFVEMDREEMMYVDGGGISVQDFALGIDLAIVAISFVCSVVGAFVTAQKLAMIAKGLFRNILTAAAKNALVKMIKGAAWALGFTVTTAIIGATYEMASRILDFSVGGIVANIIDIADGNRNGICFG